jgi:ATP-dependent DNA helicase RecG
MTALVMMRNGVVLTNSVYRASTGVQDGRVATRELKELVDAGVVEQVGTRGSTTYQLTQVTRGRASGSAGAGGLTKNEAFILAAVAKTPLSRADLERTTGLTKDQVNYALRTLRRKGRIVLLGNLRARNARWASTP